MLNDASLRLLPVDAAEVRRMLGALRALEVNPLWVNGDQVEALDVLVVTQDASGTEQVR